jgi:anti-anti-sigma regulatory factor
MATAAHIQSSSRIALPSRRVRGHSQTLRARVDDALSGGEQRLVVDCGEWRNFDLAMLSSLIQCASACREHGVSFEILNLSHDIRRDVRDLGLHDRLGLVG